MPGPVPSRSLSRRELEARRLARRHEFILRSDVAFLNHGSFGACPRPVFETYQRWQRELELQPVEFLGRRFTELMRTARQGLAAYVGADADDLVFMPNATTGLNVVARSLPLQPGDEVLATDHEYGAMDRTWRFVCGKRGARYVNVGLPLPVKSTGQVIETIWSAVTARTRVLFLSHITSPTAIILPVRELVQRARESGILTVVDGAHAPGQVALNLQELDADFYGGNCHKWLCAPKGSAFLFARRPSQTLLEPLVVSWGWRSENPGSSRFVDEQEWQGTRDIAAYLTIPAAIAFQAQHDWPRVQEDCHGLLQGVLQEMHTLTGLEPIAPDSPTWYAQMAAFRLPPCDGEALKCRLYDDFNVEVPVTRCAVQQFVRVSVQGYNTQADLDAFVSAMRALLPQLVHGAGRPMHDDAS